MANEKSKFPSLTNKRAVRDYILNRVRTSRPGWTCTRVSPQLLNQIDYKLKRLLDAAVHSHPSLGKTFREII